MQKTKGNVGIRLLLNKYRRKFRIPENLNYYSESDYQIAERKFLKYALAAGNPGVQNLARTTSRAVAYQ
ncbi:MAG: hypothetical protein KKH68_02225 [Proteobacteria bacterium]|nr:hypothetical protein [Pseudomonadota bacterium]